MTWSARRRLARLLASVLPPRRRGCRRITLGLEVLEDRTVLSPATPLPTPTPITLSATGSGTQAGSITTPGGSDYYQFTAPVTGGMAIQQDATAGSNLDSNLTVYDTSGNQITTNDNAPLIGFVPNSGSEPGINTLDSQVHFGVVAGQTYTVQAGVSPNATGSQTVGNYVLSFKTIPDDGYSHDPASPTALNLTGAGVATASGTLDTPGSADYFQFTAPTTGALAIQQNAAAGSDLMSSITVFDSSGAQVINNQDNFFGDVENGPTSSFSWDSLVNVNVVAGQTYTIEATSSPDAYIYRTTGAYVLTIAPLTTPSFPTTQGSTTPVTLDASGSATVTGTITGNADPNNFNVFTPTPDWYQVNPTVSGALNVQAGAAAGSDFQGYLFLEDSSGNPVASGYGQLQANVDSSQTYYLKVTGSPFYFYSNTAVGAYVLTFSTIPQDNFSTDSTNPTTLTLDPTTNSASASGAVTTSGGDWFQFTALTTGNLVIEQDAAPGSTLNSALTVYDHDFNTLAYNDDINFFTNDNSQVQISVVAGDTYYVNAAAAFFPFQGTTTGAFNLTITPAAQDNYGDTFGNATPLTLSNTGSGTVTGAIENTGSVDVFSFQAPVTGALTIQQDAAAGSNLDSQLSVYDATGNLITSNDDASYSTYNSQVQLDVVQGQTFYVQAAASTFAFGPTTSGAYVLSFATLADDGYSHDQTNPSALPLSPTGTPTASGTITSPDSADYFQFTPTSSGVVTIALGAAAGSDLNTYLAVYDPSGNLLASNDDASYLTSNSQLQLNVVAGQTYVIGASASGQTAGDYVLSIGSTFAAATAITLDNSGAGSQTGLIAVPGQSGVYQFTATVTGGLTIQQSADSGSQLDSFLSVYDSSQNLLASNDNNNLSASFFTLDSQVQINVVAGQTYYVQAAASPSAFYSVSTTGAYVLTFNTIPQDGFSHSFDTPSPLALDSTGAGTVDGTITLAGDSDVFSFVAPVTGGMTVRQHASAGSNLDSYLSIYDASRNLIVANDDSVSDSVESNPLDSQVRFDVVAGQTYYVRAAASPFALGTQVDGAYHLTLTTLAADSYGTTFATATPLPLANSNPGAVPGTLAGDDSIAVTGTIAAPDTVNFFQFTATTTGALTIQQQAPAGSVLDSYLSVYDASHNLIAANDNLSNYSFDSRLQINAVAGQTYYIRTAGGTGGGNTATGAYLLTVGSTFGNANPLTVDVTNTGSASGTIAAPGQINAYQFTAQATGLVTVQLQAAGGSSLDTNLSVYGPDQKLLVTNDDAGAYTTDSQVQLNVVAGQTYYIQTTDSPNAQDVYSLGDYTVTVAGTLANAAPLTVDGTNTGGTTGTIASSGQLDAYQFTAQATGSVTVQLQAAQGSTLDAYLSVYGRDQQLLATNDDASASTTDSSVQFNVVAGQTYYLVAGTSPYADTTTSTGDYVLSVAGTFVAAAPVTLDGTGAGSATGTIRTPGQADTYQFTAATTGQMTIEDVAPPGSGLDTYLSVYDGNQQLLVFNQGGGGHSNSVVHFDVVAGQTYYVLATSNPADTSPTSGDYQLAFTTGPVPADDGFGHNLSNPTSLILEKSDAGARFGSIDQTGQLDVFQVVPTKSGQLIVRESATSGNPRIQGSLYVLNGARQVIASATGDATSAAALTFNATADQTYYVVVGGVTTTVGDYELTIQAKAHGSTFTDATPLSPDPFTHGATATGAILTDGAVDMFQFTAVASGTLVIDQTPSTGSRLDGSVTIYDSNHNVLGSASDGGSSGNQVDVSVTVGSTYYVQVAASPYAVDGGRTGDYRLTIADPFASATPITLTADTGSATGTITGPGNVQTFQFTAPHSGQFVIEQDATAGSSLDSYLTILGSNQQVLASNDDLSYPFNLNSQVTVSLTSGQTYYIQASASPFAFAGTATGAFVLTVSAVNNTATGGHTNGSFGTATPLTLDLTGAASVSGTIGSTGSVDFYKFQAKTTGLVTITQDAAAGSNLDSYLTVYNHNQQRIGANDDVNYPSNLDSQVEVSVTAGQVYYIEAAASPFPATSPTGAYVLNVIPVPDDGFGNSFATATPVALDHTGSASVSGVIGSPGSADYLQFTAASSGTVAIALNAASGSSLDTYLTVYDGNQNQIALSDNASPWSTDSLANVAVVAGQTYYIKAAASPFASGTTATGAYVLTLNPVVSDGYGNSFATATPISLDGTGAASLSGSVETPGSVDVFQFTATVTGSMTITQDAAPGSNLDSYLIVYDSSQHFLTSNDDVSFPTNLNSQVVFGVQAGQTYYLQAAASPYAAPDAATGNYLLSLSTGPGDGYGNTLATATPIYLDLSNAASVTGNLQSAGTSDFLQFTPTVSGVYHIEQDAAAGSNLDTALTVYELQFDFFTGAQTDSPVASNDDLSPSNSNSAADVYLSAFQTYIVQAGASPTATPGTATGGYTLAITQADQPYGFSLDTATPITLDDSGSATLYGTLDSFFGPPANYIQFTASTTGQMVVSQAAVAGSTLNGAVTVFDSNGDQIAFNDDIDYPSNLNSQITFDVTAGQTYTVESSVSPYASFTDTYGGYVLTLSPAPTDSNGQTFDAATTLTIDPTTGAVAAGAITAVGGSDVFEFTAPTTGAYRITQNAKPGSNLDSYLTLYDSNQNLIASNDDVSGSDLNSALQVSLVQGQTYYVEAAASPNAVYLTTEYPDYHQTATGAFNLAIRPIAADGFGNTLATATPLTLNGSGAARVTGDIQGPNLPDVFVFTAASTTDVTITQDAAGASNLDSYLTVYDGNQNPIASNDDSGGTRNSRVTVHVVAGQTYYIEAGASSYADVQTSTGRYVLTLLPAGADGYGDSLATATTVSLGTGTEAAHVNGNVETAGSVDFFQFTPDRTGQFTVRMNAAINSSVDPYLFVYDINQNGDTVLVTSDDNGGGGLNSLIEFNVVQGQTYYVEAVGARGTTGEYGLTFSPPARTTFPTFSTHDTAIQLDHGNNGRINGSVEAAGSTNFYQFQAAQTGWVTIQENALAGSSLDALLTVYNSSEQQIAANDDSNGTLNSEVLLHVRQGQTYYVEADGFGLSTGAFEVVIADANPPVTPNIEDFGTAEATTLSAAGSANLAGTLNLPGDVTMYQFTAVAGQLTVTLTPPAGSDLDASLRLFTPINGELTQVASNDLTDAGAGQAQTIALNVTAGQTYYLRVASSDTDTTTSVSDAASDPRVGDFNLTLQTGPTVNTGGSSGGVNPTTLQNTSNTLRDSFAQTVAATGYTNTSDNTINQAVIQAYLQSVGGRVSSDTLILWFDPSDEIVTDPSGRQLGYQTDRGTINENSNASLAHNGSLQLLIIPNALAGSYNLDLTGVGQTNILAGASLITTDGFVVQPQITLGGQAVASLTDLNLTKSGLEVVLDFSTAAQATPIGPLGPGGLAGEGGLAGALLASAAQPGQAAGAAFNLAASLTGGVVNASFSNLGTQSLGAFGAVGFPILVSGLGTLLTTGPSTLGGEAGTVANFLDQLPREIREPLQTAAQIASVGSSYVVSTASTLLESAGGMLHSVTQTLGLDALVLSGPPMKAFLDDLATTFSQAAGTSRAALTSLAGSFFGLKGEPASPAGARLPPPVEARDADAAVLVEDDAFFEALPASRNLGAHSGMDDEIDGLSYEGIWEDLDRVATPLATSLIVCGLHQAFWMRRQPAGPDPRSRRPALCKQEGEE